MLVLTDKKGNNFNTFKGDKARATVSEGDESYYKHN
jgi:hypothetical protein